MFYNPLGLLSYEMLLKFTKPADTYDIARRSVSNLFRLKRKKKRKNVTKSVQYVKHEWQVKRKKKKTDDLIVAKFVETEEAVKMKKIKQKVLTKIQNNGFKGGFWKIRKKKKRRKNKKEGNLRKKKVKLFSKGKKS